jgi:hypothetical protein
MSALNTFYKSLAPVNKLRHANWCVVGQNNFEFARHVHSMPLTAVEFPQAAREYVVVFAKAEQQVMPIVILGVKAGENLFVDEQGQWVGQYVPAFVRRYPFIFSTQDDGKTLTLCLDEDFSGLRQQPQEQGERFFDDKGEQTPYLNKVLDFLKEFQGHFLRTQAFGKKLADLDLLEPMGAQFKTPDGREGSLTGFFVVNREKLKKVSAEKLAELVETDELEMIYHHLNSLNNLQNTINRVK